MKRLSMLVWVAAAVLLTGAAFAQNFKLGFEGCPSKISGQPGEQRSIEIYSTLTTTNAPGRDGAQGWSVSLAVTGGTVSAVTVKGVHVSTRYDEDGDDPDENGTTDDDADPTTPEIPATPIVDPYDLDLNGADFKVAQKANSVPPLDAGIAGAVSAIVLRNTQKMVLQPSGTQRLLKLTINVTIPEEGCTPLTIRYLDGLKGLGQPVKNVVTFGGASISPTTESCNVQVCATGPEFNLGWSAAGGAVNGAGEYVVERTGTPGAPTLVDVNVLLTTANLSGKDGPQGWSVSVSQDSCMTVDSVTVKGVHVSTRYDDDGDDPDENGTTDDDADPTTPEIPATPIVDPYDLDLNGADFKVAQKATGVPPLDPSTVGVVSAIVLRNTQKMVLHPNASDTLLRIVFKVPDSAIGSAGCKVQFIDGLKGLGQPVKNVITLGGASKSPTSVQTLVIRLVEGPQTAPFVRGDPNNDGKADIADAVWIVYDIVPGLNGGHAACRDTLDANGDGKADLVDAVYIIDWQFRAGPAPKAPYPSCSKSDASTAASCPAGSTNCVAP
jgi:hypothetical protein